MWQAWLLIHSEIKMQPGATVTAVWREAGKHLDLFATGTDGTEIGRASCRERVCYAV